MWGALSDERTDLSFTVAAGPRQRILGSESRGTHNHILLSQIRDSPHLEGQVPVFISPRNRVAQLYPQAPGSLFVASCDTQGYGGGRIHLNNIFIEIQSVPHRKHCVSITTTSPLMLSGGVLAVYCVGEMQFFFLNAQASGIYRNHCASGG
jgi:hypothetical protein